jgi:hypothetical protein
MAAARDDGSGGRVMPTLYLLVVLVSTTTPRETDISVAARGLSYEQCEERARQLHAMTQKDPLKRERFVCAKWNP